MEKESSLCLEKNFAAVVDNMAINVYDINKKTLISTQVFQDNIVEFTLKNGKDFVYLIASDSKGVMHVINVNKNEKINIMKNLHEYKVKISPNSSSTLLYALDTKTNQIRVFNFVNGDLQQCIKIKKSQSSTRINHFDIDEEEKYIIFNEDQTINMLNLNNNKTSTIGEESALITQLSFSSDGKFILSLTSGEYFINVWHKNGDGSPLITLQCNSIPLGLKLFKVDKGIYHAFVYNMQFIYVYKLILADLDTNSPVKPGLQIEFTEKNLFNFGLRTDTINPNSQQNLFVLYGNTLSISSDWIRYSKNAKSLNEVNIRITKQNNLLNSTNNKKATLNSTTLAKSSNNTAILDDIDMNNEDDVISTDLDMNEFKKIFQLPSVVPGHKDEKLSLLNTIKNSLINKDNNVFNWCLDQSDITLIESTVQKMDAETVKAFIGKLIELFQSSTLYKRNLIAWLDLLFKHHFFLIVTLPSATLTNLRHIQNMIESLTRNLPRLIEVSSKLDTILNLTKVKPEVKKEEITNEPLLIYNESESEDEKKAKKKLKSKMEVKGIKPKKQNKSKTSKQMVISSKDDEIFDDEDDLVIDEDFANIDDELNDENMEDLDDLNDEFEDEDDI